MSLPRLRSFFVADDFNGFLGLLVDNLSVMAFLAMALIQIFGFPADVVYTRMFPGTALGIMLGNLAYSFMAYRLAHHSGRTDITAMPLGVDAPTSISMALLVLGPAFLGFKQKGMAEHAAAIATWQLGMASLVVMGVLKTVLSFFGAAIQRHVPRAGLLGSIAGIALVLMGFFPLVEIMKLPAVGFAGLGIVFYALVAKGRMPWRLPGVLVATLAGFVLYESLGSLGWLGQAYHPPAAWHFRFALPWPTLQWIHGLPATVPYLPLLLPFGLLMVVGGINVTESARVAGDSYNTRDILLVEALATLIAGCCGGVAQTTPYIGQPAYKAMGARLGYTLLAGIVVGLGGVFGYLSNLVEMLPLAVLSPILIFVAISITQQAFEATPPRYFPAVIFSFFPPIARMLAIKLDDPTYVAPANFAKLYGDASQGISELAVVNLLGNGFIITSMIWASLLVAMIDGRPARAAWITALGGLLSLFGIIHSVTPIGNLYLPWTLDAATRSIVLQFAGAYFVLAAILLAFSRTKPFARV